MSLVIELLSLVLCLSCFFLGLLILVQLPKKEAGMGTAFGGDAAVALFGAGTGNALTKLTKYTAGVFFFLCFTLTWLTIRQNSSQTAKVREALARGQTPAAGAATPGISAGLSNLMAPSTAATNATPVAPATNPVAPKRP